MWKKSLAPNLSSRGLTLGIAVKSLAKMYMKLFLSWPVLLDISILFQIICLGLYTETCNAFKYKVILMDHYQHAENQLNSLILAGNTTDFRVT